VGIVVAAVLTQANLPRAELGFSRMLAGDGFATFFTYVTLVVGGLTVLASDAYLADWEQNHGEYYCLVLLSMVGMLLMGGAMHLLVFFLGLETMSIAIYALAGFLRTGDNAESGLKYFILGGFSSAFLLYGIALLYGTAGTTQLQDLLAFFKAQPALLASPLALAGVGLLLVGFLFKVAAVPFHMWTPDVYQGAPTPVTGFMAVGAKAAGFAALLRVFIAAFPVISGDMVPVLWGLAALTMVVGNVVAISQTNIKRMLAYSSIAHAGYILMALVAYGIPKVSQDAIASALFYLVTYAITSFGSWAVVIALEKGEGKGLEIADFAGLGRKRPVLAAAMTVFMLSLTGMPPTLGLVGKFYLFRTAIEGGFIGLAVIGVLTSLVSAYYYLRVVVTMYMQPGEPETSREPWLDLTWAAAALGTVVLSFLPMVLFAWASGAGIKLF
jgi:NADH-quinone oxidoreductase subunit N